MRFRQTEKNAIENDGWVERKKKKKKSRKKPEIKRRQISKSWDGTKEIRLRQRM